MNGIKKTISRVCGFVKEKALGLGVVGAVGVGLPGLASAQNAAETAITGGIADLATSVGAIVAAAIAITVIVLGARLMLKAAKAVM